MCFFKIFKSSYELPHPEENITMGLHEALQLWLINWKVSDPEFWKQVKITVVEKLYVFYNGQLIKVSAATTSETMTMQIDDEWVNPGVLSHEFSHIAWSYLTDEEKTAFKSAYLQNMDAPLVERVLDKMSDKDPNWKYSIIEIHGDLYRYLGQSMPNGLRKFYPHLLED